MTLNNVSSGEFSFPSLTSYDSSQLSGIDSHPLWKHSPDRGDYDRGFARLVIGKDEVNDQTRTRSLCNDKIEEKMDMLSENLNEDLSPRSQSLRIDSGSDGGDKAPSVFPNKRSTVKIGCGMKLTKNTPPSKESLNVLVLLRILKKLIVMGSSYHRSPAKSQSRISP